MLRKTILTVCCQSLFPLGLRAQKLMIQLSGTAEIGNFDCAAREGVLLRLAPVPGFLPTQADRRLPLPRLAKDLPLLTDQQRALRSRLTDIREQFCSRHKQLIEALTSQTISREVEKLQ